MKLPRRCKVCGFWIKYYKRHDVWETISGRKINCLGIKGQRHTP